MSANDCIEQVRAAMAGATDEEVTRMAEEAQRIVGDRVGKSTDEINKALDAFILDETIAKKIEVRNTALNEMAYAGAIQFIRSYGKDYKLALESLLVGSNRVMKGARRSVSTMQKQLMESYHGGMTADLEATGHFDLFTSGALDDDIARALWQIGNGDDFTGLMKEAVDVAKVVHKWQETARLDANEAGAWIKNLPGYITRQSHDMDKIRKAGFEAWRDEILPKLDARTFDGVEDRDAFLVSLWEALSSGVHLGTGSVKTEGLKGLRNVGRSMSQERIIHFKDADSWLEYNRKFGRGELRDTIFTSMIMSAQNTGLMRILGPNAESTYNRIVDYIKSHHRTDKGFDKFMRSIDNGGAINNYLAAVTGEMNIPGGHKMLAQWAGAVRAINSLTMLGKAVISSIADIPVTAAEFRYQGKSFFTAYGEALANAGGALGDMGKSILNRKLTVKSVEHRRILAELGVSLDATTGLFTNRFDATGDMPGRFSKGVETFMRWNGLTIWTDSMRAGAALGMASRLASYSGMTHGRLPKGIQDTLLLYGIGKDEWNLISKAGTKSAEGVEGNFITPELIRDMPDNLVVEYLQKLGVEPTEYRIRKSKKEIAESLRSYYVDRSQYAVVEPDAKTRATMLHGTQPGTVHGELMRSIMQFKAFPMAIVQRVWGRELYGREGTASSIKGLGEVIVMSTLFGYLAMTAKDLSRNRTPRDPENYKTWLAAFTQGGGAGIYGDFLFGDVKNRFGGGALDTLAGPTAGQFNSLMDIYGRIREGDIDAGKQLFRVIYQNAPSVASAWFPAASVLNAGYTKAVLDNLIYYNVMESLSPGYKRRMERRMKREMDQTFLIR